MKEAIESEHFNGKYKILHCYRMELLGETDKIDYRLPGLHALFDYLPIHHGLWQDLRVTTDESLIKNFGTLRQSFSYKPEGFLTQYTPDLIDHFEKLNQDFFHYHPVLSLCKTLNASWATKDIARVRVFREF
ncbi:hypothetical protein [Pelagibaculum spongiae]|nr:hypothetical protein [Pelagibaculum spongiae]